MQKLEELAAQLPPDTYQEAQDFIEFLLKKHAATPRTKPEFQWAGALKDMREQYTSVELQHQVTEWREPDRKGTKTVFVELPERILAEIAGMVANGWFADEAEIIRAALWEFVHRHRSALVEQFQRADIAWALQLRRHVQAGESVL